MESQSKVSSNNNNASESSKKNPSTSSETSSASSVSSSDHSNEAQLERKISTVFDEYQKIANTQIETSFNDALKTSKEELEARITDERNKFDKLIEQLKTTQKSITDKAEAFKNSSEQKITETDSEVKKANEKLEKGVQNLLNTCFDSFLKLLDENKIQFKTFDLEQKDIKGLSNFKSWYKIYGPKVVNKFFGIEKEVAKKEENVPQVDATKSQATTSKNDSVDEIITAKPADNTKQTTNNNGLFSTFNLFKKRDNNVPTAVKTENGEEKDQNTDTEEQKVDLNNQSNSITTSTATFNNSNQTLTLPLAQVKEENNKAIIQITPTNNTQETDLKLTKEESTAPATVNTALTDGQERRPSSPKITLTEDLNLNLNKEEGKIVQDNAKQSTPPAENSFTNPLFAKQNSFSDVGQQKIDSVTQPDPNATTYVGNGFTNKPRSPSQSSQ